MHAYKSIGVISFIIRHDLELHVVNTILNSCLRDHYEAVVGGEIIRILCISFSIKLASLTLNCLIENVLKCLHIILNFFKLIYKLIKYNISILFFLQLYFETILLNRKIVYS